MTLKKKVFLLISTLFVLLIIIIPNLFIAKEVAPDNRFKPEISVYWHIVYGTYFIFLLSWAFRNLLLKYRKSDGIWHRRLREVFIATLVAGCGGVIFSVIIPILYNDELAWLGSVFTVFMAAYIWYHIFWKSHQIKN